MSFKTKTILGIAFIEAILLLIIVLNSMSYLEDSNTQQMMTKANTTINLSVSMSKDAVLSYDLASLETFLDEILANTGIKYAKILSSQRNVISQKGPESILLKKFKSDSDIETINDGILDMEAPILVENENFGYIQMGFSISELEQQIDKARTHISVIALVEIILSALFSLALGTALTKRLSILKKASEKISKGNFEIHLGFKSSDEIGQVGEAFDLMTTNLKHSQAQQEKYLKELEDMNEKLEQKVEERTASLKESHDTIAREKAEQETLIKELQNTRAQLIQSEKMASIGQLSAGIAHEINNPVGFIMSNLEMMKTQVEDLFKMNQELIDTQPDSINSLNDHYLKIKKKYNYDFLKEDLSDIVSETIEGSERVKKIVTDLKNYSHMQERKVSSFDLNQGIKSTINIAQNEIKYNSEIILNLNQIPEINACESEINQVILNLIVNASQAIEDKGSITISTQIREENVLLKIKDTGCGIPEENLNKIFDPFFTTKPVGVGTGLGLSLAYGIIENNNAKICVNSQVGLGTEFTISFPIQEL